MKKIKSIKFMSIVVVSLFISSYSYGTGPCLLGVGDGCDQSTTTPQIVRAEESGGSSGGNQCLVLKSTWENHKINIATIKKEAKGKLKKLKKSFKLYYAKSKKAFKANYKKTILPRARKQQKSVVWIRNDYSRRWNRYKSLKKEKYYSARKAIIDHAKSEIKWRKDDMKKIKEEYGRKCKSKK